MSNQEKIEGIKELDVIYIHEHPDYSDRKLTFEPVEADSIRFGTSWLEFKCADSGTVVHIPTRNIFDVWVSDFYQPKKQ